MRLTWSKLRCALRKEISGLQAEKAFNKPTTDSPTLRTLGGPQATVEWLLDYKSHDRGEEDAVLRELRHQSQMGFKGPWLAVLFLGMWPVMEWTFRRMLTRAKSDGEAISAIWGGLAVALGNNKIWDEPGVARRLMYFVDRRAKADLTASGKERKGAKRVWAYLDAGVPKFNGLQHVDDSQETPHEVLPAFLNPPSREDDSDEGERRLVRQLLVDRWATTEPEADLLIRHFVQGDTLAAMAMEMGETKTNCRARCSRAICRLRKDGDSVRNLLVTLCQPERRRERKEPRRARTFKRRDTCR